MTWFVLAALTGALFFAFLVALQRRSDLRRMSDAVERREVARRQGAEKAELQHPVVDLSRCLGCATCVAACPEDGVLELVHGQAAVVRGARCIGAGACERECPVDAITVTIGDTSDRRDIPALSPGLEAIGAPGLFLAGEVTAHALIKTAIDHGTLVAAEVAQRLGDEAGQDAEAYDLCIVGAGPAGIAASLEAQRRGLSFVTIDQETQAGGTIARYPRRKLITTQPIELPVYGSLRRTSFEKEELMELWNHVIEDQKLPVHGGITFHGVERDEDGRFTVRTDMSPIRARNVCLALGRRGAPRRLGVPGEESPNVAYSLLDARSYAGRRVVVVGGGDSAVEAAVALAEQEGTEVTISYRRSDFFRVKSANAARIDEAIREGRVQLAMETHVSAITPGEVHLADANGNPYAPIPCDDVFVMIGGIAPTEVLEASGVSFDPALRAPAEEIREAGTGLVRALGWALALTLATLLFAAWNLDYYALERSARPAHLKHDLLRPGRGLGLGLGIGAIALVAVNLLYLVRRSPRFVQRWGAYPIGSLRGWMTSHVATGVLAFLFALLHAAMAPRDTVGSHAMWALLALLVTGAIGRYLYAWVPRAANGRELELDEVRGSLATMSGDWDQQHHGFGGEARQAVSDLIERRQWRSGLIGRISGVILGNRDLRRTRRALAASAISEGLSPDQVTGVLALTTRAYRSATHAAHIEDLRALMGSWRYIHRWVAALMVTLAAFHIGHALFYGQMFGPDEPMRLTDLGPAVEDPR